MSGLGPILGAFGTIAGLGMQNARQHRSYMQQRNLMNLQFQNQQKLNQQGYDMQMQMWKDTNYPAQMKMLAEAGLNPSLLYGSKGGGGTTTGSQSGGSASGGSAPAPMDIGGAVNLGMMASQMKLLKAQAKKTEAEANKIEGVDTAKTEAETLNIKSQTRLNELGLEIGNATKEDQIDKVTYEVEQLIKQNNYTDEQSKVAKAQVLEIGARELLHKANINVNEQQVKSMIAEIQQGWEKIAGMYEGLRLQGEGNKINLMQGQQNLTKIQNDWLIAVMNNKVDWAKLSVEQQKIFAKMFGDVLGNSTNVVTESMPKRQ